MRVAMPISVPELGSSLGRIAVPAVEGADWVALDEVREGLLIRVLQLASEARRHAGQDERDEALVALGRTAWVEAWEWAVRASSDRIAGWADQALEHAGWRVRMPKGRRRALALTVSERSALTARLGSAGAPFVEALDDLEVAAHSLREATVLERRILEAWADAVLRVARRLEAAWLELHAAAARERERWAAEVERVERWRRPLWPAFVLGLPLAALLAWLGLVQGGYLPPPSWFQGWPAW